MDAPTLKQLRYFEALARHGHFGRAAEVSAISQPALSVQIRDLEAKLGIALFERGHRSLRLTAFGERFRRRAREILRAVDDLGELARVARGGLHGFLRLGIIPTVAPYILPRLMRHLGRDFPDLDVNIRETTTGQLLDEVKEGRIDTAIVALPVSEPSLQEARLFRESFVLVRPASERDHPVPDRTALREMRLLLLEEGHCFRDQALSFCEVERRTTMQGLDATSLSTLVQMVGAGMGLTLIPEMAVGIETRSAPVAIARFDPPEPARTLGLVWRRTSPLAAQMQSLADSLSAAFGQGPHAAPPVSEAG